MTSVYADSCMLKYGSWQKYNTNAVIYGAVSLFVTYFLGTVKM